MLQHCENKHIYDKNISQSCPIAAVKRMQMPGAIFISQSSLRILFFDYGISNVIVD